MNNVELFEMLSENPETLDFIVRQSEYTESVIKNNPDIVVAQILSGRYALCYSSREDFIEITKALGSSYISAASLVLGLLDRPNLEAAGIIQVQEQPYLNLTGQGTIIGFIDTGIDYTLDIFRYEDGTSKIVSIYDQTGTENPPKGFFLGTEYTREQINEALKSADPYSVVPERDISGHGTFLASVAAGSRINNYISAAPMAEIIAVKLRKARKFYLERYSVPKEQENAFESSAVMLGVEYVMLKARELNRPAVICIGIGTNFGSHDGFSLFEEYLAITSTLNGICVCVAGGNESQARHHTQGVIAAQGESQNIDIKVGDENAGDAYISIWNSVSDRIAVSVRSPTGELVGKIPPKFGTSSLNKFILEPASVLVEYYFPVEGSGGQLTVVKILNATQGIWTISVYGDIILNGTYHAWLPLTGFVSPSIEFLSAIPYYTTTVPSTKVQLIACGAYNSAQNSLYSKSSWGPTRDQEVTPDLVAPGVNIGGFYPYGAGTMDGTSVATAIVSGACAMMLEWGIVKGNDPALGTYQIKAYLIRGCSRSESMTYPNPQWGYGKLNLMQTFHLMREL